MKRLVKWIFRNPPQDLELVAQGIDQVFLLWFLCTGLILGAMLGEMALNVSLFAWTFPFIGIVGFVGMSLLAYRIGTRAIHAGWLLGTVPSVLILCLIVIYSGLADSVSLKVVWTLAGMLFGPSFCGSVIGYVQHKKQSRNAT